MLARCGGGLGGVLRVWCYVEGGVGGDVVGGRWGSGCVLDGLEGAAGGRTGMMLEGGRGGGVMGGGDADLSDDVCGLMFDSKWEGRKGVGRVGSEAERGTGRKEGGVYKFGYINSDINN